MSNDKKPAPPPPQKPAEPKNESPIGRGVAHDEAPKKPSK